MQNNDGRGSVGRLELDLLLRLTHCRPWASHFPFQNFPPNQGQSFPLELVWCGLNGIKCAQSGVDNLLTKCLLNEQVNYFIEHLVGGRHCSRCGDMLMKKTGKPRLLEPSIIAEKQTMRNEDYFSRDQHNENQNGGGGDSDEKVEGYMV